MLFRQHDLTPQPYPKSLETEDDDAEQDKDLAVRNLSFLKLQVGMDV